MKGIYTSGILPSLAVGKVYQLQEHSSESDIVIAIDDNGDCTIAYKTSFEMLPMSPADYIIDKLT